ncbi:MAG: hypothetical protein AB7K68_03920 [Bacteriovoracia bacterium]
MQVSLKKAHELQSGEIDQQYLALVNQFQHFLLRNGINRRTFSAGGLEHFRLLPIADKEKYFRQLRDYFLICQDLEEESIDALRNPRQALRSIAFRFRVSIPEEFINQLTGEEIVEIFDFEGTQLFRNLTFFDISDYTIDDFFGRSWDYLYERSKSVTNIILDHVEKVAKMKTCLPLEGPEHYMRERATENRKIVKVTFGHIAPLLRDGQAIAWIASTTAKEVLASSDQTGESIHFI